MQYNSGLDEHNARDTFRFYSTGDSTLDQLLKGGFKRELVYLLVGDRKITSDILLTTAVTYFKHQGLTNIIAFVDGNNRFNPYTISKLAVQHKLSPTQTLKQILIARAFTYDQMIELLENRIAQLEQVKVVLISGITSMWPNYEQHTFEELLRAISGIKKVMEQSQPLIILTAPQQEYSLFKPVGGNILYHFGHVIILIQHTKRNIIYSLIQHPSLPENEIKKWEPQKPKRGLRKPFQNATLDQWFKS